MSKQRQGRKPIHYGFISIDEECCVSSTSAQQKQDDDPPSFTLLQQFYNELMIPTFPIEDERDDIQDWYTCFRAQMKAHQHRMNVKRQNDIKNVLTVGLQEEGIASKVQHFATCGEEDDEGNDQFDGPAMDVILMVQDYDYDDDYDYEKVNVDTNADNENTKGKEHGTNNDNNGRYFFKRSSTSLLRGSQTSLYGGLYSPNDKEVEEDDGDHDAHSESSIKRASWSGNRLLRNQSSTTTIFEDEEIANNNIGDDDGDAGKVSGANQCFVPRRRSSLLRVRESSLYGGLYAPDTGKDVEEENNSTQKQHVNIIGGAAVEYYKQSRVGLLSYVVLHNQYRGCGLAKFLHEEALLRLEMLAANYHGSATSTIPQQVKDRTMITSELESSNMNNVNNKEEPLMRAVFAETNTPSAGDVTHEQSLLRHQSLYNLGYRLVKFPYAQPPLTTEDVDASFNDIVLLVYFPLCYNQVKMMNEVDYDNNNVMTNNELIRRYCPWFNPKEEIEQHRNGGGDIHHTVRMSVDIPFQYIEDFYQSVFGYNNSVTEIENIDHGLPNYRIAKYYKFVHWFAHNHCCQDANAKKRVKVSLCRPITPWEDCKKGLFLQFEEWNNSNNENHS